MNLLDQLRLPNFCCWQIVFVACTTTLLASSPVQALGKYVVPADDVAAIEKIVVEKFSGRTRYTLITHEGRELVGRRLTFLMKDLRIEALDKKMSFLPYAELKTLKIRDRIGGLRIGAMVGGLAGAVLGATSGGPPGDQAKTTSPEYRFGVESWCYRCLSCRLLCCCL